MLKQYILVPLICLVMVPPVALGDESGGLHDLLDRVEKAWGTRDRQLLAEQYAEDGFLLITEPNEGQDPRVLTREQTLSGIADSWARSGVKSHRFSTRDPQPLGAIARLFLTVADTFPDGRGQTSRVMTLARRGPGRWQMCFGMPQIVHPAVLVTQVLEGSQAERMGIKPGDVIAEYAGQAVTSTTGLIDQVKAARDKAKLTVVRANDRLALETAPGTLGAKVEDRLLPEDGVEIVSEPQPHPVKEVLARQLAACQAGDVKLFHEILHPSGYLGWEQTDSDRPVPVTLANFDEHFRQSIAAMRRAYDLSSAKMENVRLAVRGGVALASYHFVSPPIGQVGGQPVPPIVSLGVYVRQKDRWYLTASLPIKAELGLEFAPEQPAAPTLRRDQFVGVGIQIKDVEDGLLIQEVLPDSGAERAGLKAGQMIVAIDGQSTRGMEVAKATELLRGAAESKVKIEARTGSGQTRAVEVTRGVVKVPTIEHSIVRGKIGLLTIKGFGEQTAADVSDVLTAWSQRGVAGVLIDLRGNRGGIYTEVIKVAGMFVGEKKTLWIIKDAQGKKQEVKSNTRAAASLPLVVMIDRQTRSGGELLASALKENADATLVGYPTAGEALLKERISQPGGGSAIVGRGEFLTAGGLPLTGRPVAPHVACPDDASPAAVLNRAQRVLLDKLKGKQPR